MFETLPAPRGSRSAYAASLGVHVVLVALLVVPPLLAVQEPPDPGDGFVRIDFPPGNVQLAGDRREERPALLRKGNREDQGGPRRTEASVPVATAPQSFERKKENEVPAPPETQPQGIPQLVPDAPDAPSLFPFEARERSERIGAGSGGGTGNERGGAGDPDGCEGCPPGPIVIGPDVVPPVALATPEPRYPQAAFQARLSGWVVLEAIIGVDGNIRDVRVVRSSSPLFEAAAAEGVRRWQYRPARIGARAVSVYLNVNVTFVLRS